VFVLLTWLYLSSLAILFGAELNSEIEHASPYGKAPGEKVPGERRRLGAAAERYFEKKGTGAVTADFAVSPAAQSRGLRASDVLIAAVSLIPLALRVGREAARNADSREGPGPQVE